MTRSGRTTRRSGATSAEESQDALAVWESLNNSSAVIEFDLEGIVLSANANFLELMGYREDELIGKHHSLLMPPEETTSAAYKQFWNNLQKGQFFSGEFRRCRKDGSGVPTVDTAVANQLIKITKATRIMGCETLVSGVASSIAHTIVELGVDISELRTTATLRDAFFTCLTEMGILSVGAGGYGQGGYGQGGCGQPGPQPMMHRPSQRQLHIH